MSRVFVCGSLNMDVVVQSARRPAVGETLLGGKAYFLPGGKGLNQAVAAARVGVRTAMRGAVGNDPFGRVLRAFLAANGITRTGVRIVDGQATGVALIQVAEGDNAITVASGANMHFTAEMVPQPQSSHDVWVAQFETPLRATETIFERARAIGARTVLNMAPFVPYPARLLKKVDVVILNEVELSHAVGVDLNAASALREIVAACEKLRAQGVPVVVATLGARGAVVVTAHGATRHPALKAKVVDTTGAGDCFVGVFAACLAAGATPVEAIPYALAAAACSVERLGAAPAMPTAGEVAARLARA